MIAAARLDVIRYAWRILSLLGSSNGDSPVSTPPVKPAAREAPAGCRAAATGRVRLRSTSSPSTCRPRCESACRYALDLVRKTDDESVAVGHAHLGQRFGVHRVVLADQLVLREDKGGERVDFVVGERARLLPRHRPPDEVEDGRRIAPEVGDSLRRVDPVDRAAAHDRGGNPALAPFAVAHRALLREDALALRGRAATGRQAGSVGQDADVPGSDVGRIYRPAEVGPFGDGNSGAQ